MHCEKRTRRESSTENWRRPSAIIPGSGSGLPISLAWTAKRDVGAHKIPTGKGTGSHQTYCSSTHGWNRHCPLPDIRSPKRVPGPGGTVASISLKEGFNHWIRQQTIFQHFFREDPKNPFQKVAFSLLLSDG